MLCWSKQWISNAPQSGKAVPQNVEALPNLATTVTVDWNDKTRTNIQTNNLSPPQ